MDGHDSEVPEVPFCKRTLTDWPKVVIELLRPPVNDDEIDAFQAQFTDILILAKNGGSAESGILPCKLFLVFNVDGIVKASWAQRIRAAGLIKAVREYAAETVDSTALIATNPIARMILQAILMMQTLASVNEVFDKPEDAHAWLERRQQEAFAMEAGTSV
jgi:hypothetical protein